MPVYNGEQYLSLAIESLLQQTFSDFEILIADNCSTDRTVEIAEQYAASDSRIRIIEREENRGAVDNFNFVFHETKGEYFKWAAADDFCAPSFIEKCFYALEKQPEAVWCHCDSDKVDSNGNSLLERLPANDPTVVTKNGKRSWKGFPRSQTDSESPALRFKDVLLGTTWCVDSYGLFRRSALEKTRLFIDTYGAEKVMIGELALIGKYAHVGEPLFSQRIHEQASSSLDSLEKQQEYVGVKRQSYVKTRFKLFCAHLQSIHRHRIGWWNRLRSYMALTQYLFQFRKWFGMIGKQFSRRGVAGAGKRLLKSAKASENRF